MRSFKNFAYITTIGKDSEAIALALAITSPTSAMGKILFSAFPEALSDHLIPLTKVLINQMNTFGRGKLINVLNRQDYPVARFIHRAPQNDFDGGGNIPPPKVTLSALKSGTFKINEVEWVVFDHEVDRPYPVTNPNRIDVTYYCARKDFLVEK